MGAVMKMDGSPLDQRPLPHDLDAEQQLLGALLMNNDLFGKVASLVDAADFYETLHQGLFNSISEIISAGKLASPITLKPLVTEIAFPDGTTGAQYLAHLCAVASTASQSVDYAKFIRDRADLRRIVTFAREIESRAMAGHPTDSSALIIGDAEIGFSDIRRPGAAGAGQFQPFDAAVQEAMDIASAAYSNGGVLAGLSTGLHGLDEALGGLQRSDLLIVAGRPGAGKTALATNIAFSVAKDLREQRLDGKKTGVVAFFSLEMSKSQLAARILSEHCRVSGWRIRKGRVSQPEIESFMSAGETLGSLPIQIDQTGEIPIASLAMRARALKKRLGIELVVVDYLQLVKGSSRGRNDNRVQEVTEITGALKGLAKELDVPVIALSQLSRRVDERDDKRPMLSDLRESGSIEQDADAVIFVYRDAYYLQKREPPPGTERHNEWKLLMDAAHGRAELIIGKNRHGPETTVHVGFDSNLTQFNNDVPDTIPERSREQKVPKPKQMKLSKEAWHGFSLLKSFSISASIENNGHVDRAKPGARLVPYKTWRDRCVLDLKDPDSTKAKLIAMMDGIKANLLSPGEGFGPLIGIGEAGDTSYIWLVGDKD